MTAFATKTLRPIRRRISRLERTARRAAVNADRALSRLEDNAGELVETGRSFAKKLGDRIEDRPHSSVVAALLLGGLVGFLFHPRR